MREFRITLTHRAGELFRLTQMLATHDINLKSVAAISDAGKAIVCLVVEEVAQMRTVLSEARVPFEEEEVLVELLENAPGNIADLSKRLSEAGVDLLSLYVLARDDPLIEVGFTVDNPKRAKKALTA